MKIWETTIPVRKVVTRKHIGMRLLVPSIKMRRMVQCESMLEADAVLLFDWSNDIVAFEEQPCFEFPTQDGKPFRYTPDFLTRHVDGSETYIEVKPLEKLRSPKLRGRLNCVAEHFARSSCCFKVLSEDALRNESIRVNHRLLAYHARPLPSNLYFWSLVDELACTGEVSFGRMCEVLGEPRLALQLLGNRHFVFDIRTQLKDSTLVFKNPTEVRHATFQV